MRILVDTHVFLWWRADAPELPLRFRRELGNPENEVLVSAAAAWEIVIKRALGRLEFEGSVAAAVAEEGFTPLGVTLAHVDEVAALPDLHRDPFDRLLVAQARREGLVLATRDPFIRKYEGVDLLSP